MKLNFRRRDIILIAGFWLIACALLSIVFYYVLFQTGPPPAQEDRFIPQATHTLVHTEITAKSLQPRTKDQIGLWEDDAQLYTVSATWEGTTLEQVGQATPWTYRFYSPQQKRVYFVTVNPANGKVIGTSHGERVYNAPQPIPQPDWAIDSSEALNIWLNHGGATMLAAIPGLYVVTQLQVNTPGAPLTWTVAGFDQVSTNYHTIFINAKTGEVIKIKTSLY